MNMPANMGAVELPYVNGLEMVSEGNSTVAIDRATVQAPVAFPQHGARKIYHTQCNCRIRNIILLGSSPIYFSYGKCPPFSTSARRCPHRITITMGNILLTHGHARRENKARPKTQIMFLISQDTIYILFSNHMAE